MIPNNLTSAASITLVTHPSRTYRMNIEREEIKQYTDGRNSVEQAIYKALRTVRYKYAIYDWNYGIELEGLFGMPVPYVRSELERRIRECLLNDDRITAVDRFEFPTTSERTTVFVKFTAQTSFGDITIDGGVNIGV